MLKYKCKVIKTKMSLLNYLVFQQIDPSSDDDIPFEHSREDDISLKDPINESDLENYWNKVTQDIQHDPDWFTFTDE